MNTSANRVEDSRAPFVAPGRRLRYTPPKTGRSVFLVCEDDMTDGTKDLCRALAVVLIPTIAYVLHDLVFQLPDNAHEPTLGFFLTAAGLLCVWASSGYIIARGANGTGSRVIAGAVAGIVSVGMLWLTAIVLNTLFPDRMSYEPDRIRAFQQSGYATLREYLRHQGWGPAPWLMLVAAVVGAIGGARQRRTQPAPPSSGERR